MLSYQGWPNIHFSSGGEKKHIQISLIFTYTTDLSLFTKCEIVNFFIWSKIVHCQLWHSKKPHKKPKVSWSHLNVKTHILRKCYWNINGNIMCLQFEFVETLYFKQEKDYINFKTFKTYMDVKMGHLFDQTKKFL